MSLNRVCDVTVTCCACECGLGVHQGGRGAPQHSLAFATERLQQPDNVPRPRYQSPRHCAELWRENSAKGSQTPGRPNNRPPTGSSSLRVALVAVSHRGTHSAMESGGKHTLSRASSAASERYEPLLPHSGH